MKSPVLYLEPETKSDPEVLRKMAELLDLFDASVLIQRQNLRRRFPEAPAEEIEARLLAWVQKREYRG
jgi:Rv0078B-related antitoxin